MISPASIRPNSFPAGEKICMTPERPPAFAAVMILMPVVAVLETGMKSERFSALVLKVVLKRLVDESLGWRQGRLKIN